MLIARNRESQELLSAYQSEESKFIAIYGRRRIGKKYLVRQTFKGLFTFQHAGIFQGTTAEQLYEFCASLKEYGLEDFNRPANWLEAFELLKDLIRDNTSEKKVIFIDELSWMDSGHSDLMKALESFWNGWASARDDILLIVCGSATSWMLNKVVHNKGGLYNRLSLQIELEPFSLKECAEYASSTGLVMNHHQLLEACMIFGGVPYYWSLLTKERSLSQNVDLLLFDKKAPLKNEFQYLYASVFKRPEPYIAIIRTLGTKKAGMTREELLVSTHQTNSGGFSARLDELESCGFIRKYYEFGKKKKNALYQLIDNFTLFWFKFMEIRPNDIHFWQNQTNMPARNAWAGLAFERVCLQHVDQIKNALGISGVLTNVCSWSCKADVENGINGSQIDLLIDRKDQVINLCEMKYSTQEYAISRETDEKLRHKRNDFMNVTKTKSAVHLTLVTTYGLVSNSYAGNIQSVITAEDLFQ